MRWNRAALVSLVLFAFSGHAWAEDGEAGPPNSADPVAELQSLHADLSARVAALEAVAQDLGDRYRTEKRRPGARQEADRVERAKRLAVLDHERRAAEALLRVIREEDGVVARLSELGEEIARHASLREGAETDGAALTDPAALRRRLVDATTSFDAAEATLRTAFARTDGGRTALHLAAEEENLDLARAALSYDVDPDALDDEGFTALHLAAWWGADEVAPLLAEATRRLDLRARASPKDGDPVGCSQRPMTGPTAVHLAAYAGNPVVLDALLEAGADAKLRVMWRDTGAG